MAESTETTLRSYFQQGDIWEQEIIKREKRSCPGRLVRLPSCLPGIAVAQPGRDGLLMLPLKSFEP